MSVLDVSERRAYLHSPYYKKIDYGDFTPFYITISVVTVVATVLFVVNILLGCCSRHSRYWNDRHTGNRWITSLWSATPHNQPPLDYTEIDPTQIPKVVVYQAPEHPFEYSNIEFHTQSSEQIPAHIPAQISAPPQYLEMQKRESDI